MKTPKKQETIDYEREMFIYNDRPMKHIVRLCQTIQYDVTLDKSDFSLKLQNHQTNDLAFKSIVDIRLVSPPHSQKVSIRYRNS